MNTVAIRQQLHSYLEVADDKKVKAFYTMMEDDIKESGNNHSGINNFYQSLTTFN